MRLDIYHHMVYDDNCKELDIKQSLNSIFNILKQIKMEQSELAAQLTTLKDQTEKAKAEILAKLADLDAALQAADDVTPEVQAAFDALKSSVQGVDDIVADAPTPTV
jgi:archaellum component FlaC